jgi:hypothetical protein
LRETVPVAVHSGMPEMARRRLEADDATGLVPGVNRPPRPERERSDRLVQRERSGKSIASKGKKAHGGREAAKPATDGSDPKPDAEQGPGVEPTPETVPAKDKREAVTET